MPTEISHTPSVRPVPELSSSLPLRILTKGPGYLRRQMEGESRGRLSAVERLAADKAKYVKSRQVMGCEPVGPVGFGSSASEGSSSIESCPGTGAKNRGGAEPSGQDLPRSGHLFRTPFLQRPPIARRFSSKRQMRPDSLVIYRQKCEFVRGASQENPRGNHSLVRRLFQGSTRDKQAASPEVPKVIIKEGTTRSDSPESSPAGDLQVESEPEPQGSPAPGMAYPAVPPSDPPGGEPGEVPAHDRLKKEPKRRGLHRSQSDISSRYSKAYSEFDSFFKYCGLDPDVIEDLGRENFTSASDSLALRVRSVSVPGSESDFSRHSGDNDRLLEEELSEQIPSSLSVIERNARVIKWLYGCKKAKESRAAAVLV
ncbi:protein FAM110C [Heptranchias perlo]|uniref:protein FAM110C n=1 Tax=Heptranchias perlo TaxID=212740 RepID=UPI003559F65F